MNEKSGRSVGQQAAQAKPEMIGSLKSGRINGQPRMSVAQGRGRQKSRGGHVERPIGGICLFKTTREKTGR